MRRRLWVSAELPEQGGEVRLDDESAHHARVLRLQPGDPVRLFNDAGEEANAVIRDIESWSCLTQARERAAAATVRLVLVQCLPKGRKIDDIVRQTTEVGADEIRLAVSDRSVSRLEGERADHRAQRLGKIAREASRQSLRSEIPLVHAPAPLREVVPLAAAGALKLMLQPGAPHSILEELWLRHEAGECWLAIGPEGGFSAEESEFLREAGWIAVSMPTFVMRVETAAPVAVALVRAGLLAKKPA